MARVLVVEDDSSLRTVIRLVLEGAGHEVEEAPNGEAAVAALVAAVPDVVVADMTMPRMGGTALIERMRATSATASVPVIVLTGRRDAQPDADAVLVKPFEPADLLKVVGRLAARDG